jgi:hypothetical protein
LENRAVQVLYHDGSVKKLRRSALDVSWFPKYAATVDVLALVSSCRYQSRKWSKPPLIWSKQKLPSAMHAVCTSQSL